MSGRPLAGAGSEIRRVRALRDRAARDASGQCYVEGIRQVVSAIEGGCPVDVMFVDPTRLRSEVGWNAVERAQASGARVVELKPADFERISSRDNPVGLSAIVSWRPLLLNALTVGPGALLLVIDNIHDAGNLGTLIRTADGAGCAAVIVHAGVDPSHPGALRSSLGAAFRVPVHATESLNEIFDWAAEHGVATIATTAHADRDIWSVDPPFPAAVLVGNEGEGLSEESVARADFRGRIPMRGTATSLNVSVAAGVVLYELARRTIARSTVAADTGALG